MDVPQEQINELAQLRRRFEQLEEDMSRRVDAIESALAEHLQRLGVEQTTFKRQVEMKSARIGELSSRIAQRVARLETCMEMLNRAESDAGSY